MPAITKHLNDKTLLEADESAPELLKTIRIPKNMHYLTEKLPKPNYIPVKYRRSTMGVIKSLANSLEGNQDHNSSSMDVSTLPSVKKERVMREETI